MFSKNYEPIKYCKNELYCLRTRKSQRRFDSNFPIPNKTWNISERTPNANPNWYPFYKCFRDLLKLVLPIFFVYASSFKEPEKLVQNKTNTIFNILGYFSSLSDNSERR